MQFIFLHPRVLTPPLHAALAIVLFGYALLFGLRLELQRLAGHLERDRANLSMA